MPQSNQESDENSITRQDGSQCQPADGLKELEERLCSIVAEFEEDPEKIVPESLDSVKEVIQCIYRTLKADAESQNGMLADSASVWESLKTRYQEIFKATSKLRPIFKQSEELSRNRGHERAGIERYDINDRMVDRKHEWLARVTEFQHDFSAIYNEIAQRE